MVYSQDWKFKLLADLLNTKEQRQTFYDLYKISSDEVKKRLYLFLNNPYSNKIITDIIERGALLTAEGIRNYLFQDMDIFNHTYKFLCKNPDCKHNSEVLEVNDIIYKQCPECSEKKFYLINKKQLTNTLKGLYLDYFDFYLVSDFDSTIYLIHNKYANKYYMKSSDESFSNWIYLKLIENGCDVEKYLFALVGETKVPKNSLLKFVKENKMIKMIDNINFKPTNSPTFTENGKKYFNIYSGNEYLNKFCSNKELILKKDCPNIYELLFNLTGKDDKGVEYLIDVLSMIMQEPHIKTKQLIIFYGEEASGKGTLYDLILKPLFEGYITKILGKKIKSPFNGFMSKNLLLVLEEVKSDKDEEDTLKELVTEEFILINKKGLQERYENNYLTIFGFSNEQNPISAGKRRGVYFNSVTLGGSTDKSPEYRKRFEKQIPLEFDNLINILKNRRYNRMEIMKGFETDAKQQVLEQNMSVTERFYNELCNYSDLGKYVSRQISSGFLECSDLTAYTYKYKNTNYVQAEFILLLYNNYLKKLKYNSISLNKFSQFWQLIKINRTDKKHWWRIINPDDDRKTQYVNIDLINEQIKKHYEDE